MNQTVYISLKQLTQVHEKDVFLSDIADVYSSDKSAASRCMAMKILTIRSDERRHYIGSILDIIQIILEQYPQLQINSVGEQDYIIDYMPSKSPKYAWQWIKTLCICLVSFSGAAFAIMTFNNDAGVTEVFREIYRLVTGQENNGFMLLELAYSLGLAGGIIVFFNHFAKIKLNADPTPLEVEMRLYEDDVCKTLIQNDGRKESGVDVT